MAKKYQYSAITTAIEVFGEHFENTKVPRSRIVEITKTKNPNRIKLFGQDDTFLGFARRSRKNGKNEA